MPITSTQSFDGYRITEYGGYVSGDEAIELTDSYFGNGDFNKDVVNDKLKEVRSVAIDELKTAAAQIGCNAVVGLDFDYVTIDRQFPGISGRTVNRSFIILTANGTAVTIEPV
ncbi:MAG: heavy metal-binding domain-containing protein [Atopobiaceae bacterium]|nr:heavy metal-binding domain-containing protein [Atopobiaceae bacterium]